MGEKKICAGFFLFGTGGVGVVQREKVQTLEAGKTRPGSISFIRKNVRASLVPGAGPRAMNTKIHEYFCWGQLAPEGQLPLVALRAQTMPGT